MWMMSVALVSMLGCAGVRRAHKDVLANPTSPDAWTELGDAYRRRMRKENAREAYQRALSLDENHEGAQQGMASTQGSASRHPTVRAAMRNPGDDELWGDAGDYYASVGMESEALNAYTYALQLDPGDSEWRRKITAMAGPEYIFEILGSQMDAMGDEELGDMADLMMENGQRDEALSVYTRALQLDPSDSEWQRKITEIAGVEYLIETLGSQVDSMGDEGLGDLGDVLRANGDIEQACEMYRRAQRLDPSDSEWIERVGECDAGSGGVVGGVVGTGSSGGGAATDVLRSRVFSNPELLQELGMAHAQAGDLSKAAEYLHSSLLLQPTNANTLELYVAVSRRTRRQVLEQLVEEVPDNDELLGEMGDQMLAEGRTREALVYYRRALELDDDDPEWLSKKNLVEGILSAR